jgi:ketosteroid isomerase-like protein
VDRVNRDADVEDVLAAALRRAGALADRDAAALTALHHPDLRWTTFLGDVLDRELYVSGNTEGSLIWRAQSLDDPEVAVVGDTAVLTAVVRDEVERDGVAESFTLRITQTWVRTAEGWRCLAGHAGPRLGAR